MADFEYDVVLNAGFDTKRFKSELKTLESQIVRWKKVIEPYSKSKTYSRTRTLSSLSKVDYSKQEQVSAAKNMVAGIKKHDVLSAHLKEEEKIRERLRDGKITEVDADKLRAAEAAKYDSAVLQSAKNTIREREALNRKTEAEANRIAEKQRSDLARTEKEMEKAAAKRSNELNKQMLEKSKADARAAKETIKLAERRRNDLAKVQDKQERESYAQAKRAANQLNAELKQSDRNQIKDKKLIFDAEERLRKARVKEIKYEAQQVNESIRNSFVSAFSLHIVQMYLNPFIRAVRQIVSETLQIYAEFEKEYANYLAKSNEFSNQVSRQAVMQLAAGQVYTASNLASAMERFSASGIDVSKSQQALVDVMQTATVADIEYDEAANGIIRTMEAFQLTINDSTMIVDSMTNAANASTAELSDMVSWFEYAASSAFQAGLTVQDLSKYLAVLSSTGMPGAGAAFRQMLLQFTKADIREKFAERFGFTEEDFLSMDSVIKRLREYVQASDNQAKAVQEVVRLLGGKVTSQQALNNLLVAEPELWNRVSSAVNAAGTTQQLYADVTDNAAAAMERITNNLQVMKIQIGEVFGPLLKLVDYLLTKVTVTFSALPAWFKSGIIGTLMLLLTVVTVVVGGFTTLAGAIYAITGATQLFSTKTDRTTVSISALFKAVKGLVLVLTQHSGVAGSVIVATDQQTAANLRLAKSLQIVNALEVKQGVLAAQWNKDYVSTHRNGMAAVNAGTARSTYLVKKNAAAQKAAMEGAKTASTTASKSVHTANLSMMGDFLLLAGVMAALTSAEKQMEQGSFKLANSIYLLVSAVAALRVGMFLLSTAALGPVGALLGGLATFGAGAYIGTSKVNRAQTEYETSSRYSAARVTGSGTVIEKQNNNYITVDGITVEGDDADEFTETFWSATGIELGE